MNNSSREFQQMQTLAVVGVGLIGGSIALAARKRGLAQQIIGVGRNPGRLDAAREAGVIDLGFCDIAEAAAQAEMLIFCTPVDLIVAGVLQAGDHTRQGAVITDAGSVKSAICDQISEALPARASFVGSHPIAGSDKSGFEHADADLFDERVCVVTPNEYDDGGDVQRVVDFWRALGMNVLEMSPQEHDQILAATSHLPHLVAAVLASMLTQDAALMAGTGFADTTRIAAGSPEIWVPILLGNAQEILEATDAFSAQLAEFRTAIANHDGLALQSLLDNAKVKRDELN